MNKQIDNLLDVEDLALLFDDILRNYCMNKDLSYSYDKKQGKYVF